MTRKSPITPLTRAAVIVCFGLLTSFAVNTSKADSQSNPQAVGPEAEYALGCDGVVGSGKVMKACGCDLAAGPCGCSPCPVAPTRTPTVTPTCGVFIGGVTAHPNSDTLVKSFNDSFPAPNDGSPSCLTTIREKIRVMANDYSHVLDPSHKNYLDDYISIWFMDELNVRSSVFYSTQKATTSICTPGCTAGAPARIPSCWCDADGYNNFASSAQPPSPSPIECVSRAPVGQLGYEHWEGLCVNYRVYLDKDCKIVPPSLLGELRQCNGMNLDFWPSSPISLMWRGQREINSHASLVQFPLDKGRKESWYTWYGSEETPLLVYDPQHRGTVTSADQLFGNWSFGGKRTASLRSDSSAAAGPWRDGYEALASLDNNHDGEISGSELEPLALWFDRGRDAVAQPGEVVPVTNIGVTKLFIGPGEQDPATRNVHVKRGFMRKTDTGEVVGETVDWYGTGASTQAELIIKQHMLTEQDRALGDIAALLPQRSSPNERSPKKDSLLASIKDSPVSGAWFWKAKEDTQVASRGLLLIEHVAGDTLSGMTISEIPLRDTSGRLKSILSSKAITGRIAKEPSGSYKLTFSSVVAPDPMGRKEPPSISEARLSPNDRTLHGETTELLGAEKKMTYQWIATQ